MDLESMASVDGSSLQNSSKFFSLPAELRNIIYSLILNTSEQKILRPKHEVQQRPDGYFKVTMAILTDTSLLRVNKQIHREATSIFYSHHIFYYAIKLRGAREPPARLIKHSVAIKHLSVSYTANYSRHDGGQRVDNFISRHLRVIEQNFAGLRTLSVHLLPWGSCLSLLPNGKSSGILGSLSVSLERLSIISFGAPDALEEFRKGIQENRSNSQISGKFQRANPAQWTSQVPDYWPQLSMGGPEFKSAIRTPYIIAARGSEEKIRVWHLQ